MKYKHKFKFECSGIRFEIQCFNPDTCQFFENVMETNPDEQDSVNDESSFIKPVLDQGTNCFNMSALDEYNALGGPVYTEFLKHNAMVVHGLSFLYKDKVYILTAPSGTGKTTQYLNWLKLFPESIRVINGDKSILTFTDEGIQVSSSPWKGKEGFSSNLTGTLNGIICLKQGTQNEYLTMNTREKVEFLLPQILYQSDDKYIIHTICNRLTELIYSIDNIRCFINDGSLISTLNLKRFIDEQLETNNI